MSKLIQNNKKSNKMFAFYSKLMKNYVSKSSDKHLMRIYKKRRIDQMNITVSSHKKINQSSEMYLDYVIESE